MGKKVQLKDIDSGELIYPITSASCIKDLETIKCIRSESELNDINIKEGIYFIVYNLVLNLVLNNMAGNAMNNCNIAPANYILTVSEEVGVKSEVIMTSSGFCLFRQHPNSAPADYWTPWKYTTITIFNKSIKYNHIADKTIVRLNISDNTITTDFYDLDYSLTHYNNPTLHFFNFFTTYSEKSLILARYEGNVYVCKDTGTDNIVIGYSACSIDDSEYEFGYKKIIFTKGVNTPVVTDFKLNGLSITNNSITENKLSQDLVEKINGGSNSSVETVKIIDINDKQALIDFFDNTDNYLNSTEAVNFITAYNTNCIFKVPIIRRSDSEETYIYCLFAGTYEEDYSLPHNIVLFDYQATSSANKALDNGRFSFNDVTIKPRPICAIHKVLEYLETKFWISIINYNGSFYTINVNKETFDNILYP